MVALQFFQQWSGINAILYFAASLFERAGASQETAATVLVTVNAAVLVIGTFPGMWAVDRESWGRKRLLVWGAMGMAALHLAVSVFAFSAQSSPSGTATTAALGYGAVASMIMFTFVFSATWGPVVWVISSEVFSLNFRAQGTALGTVVNWSANAMIGKVSPLMTAAWGGWSFMVFSFFCFLGGLWCAFCLVETQGVPLEDMPRVFAEHIDRAEPRQETQQM